MARKDNRGRNLKVGESQRKDGLYMYRYTDERTGKRVAIYDADLAALREKERQIAREMDDGIVTDRAAKKLTVNALFERYIESKKLADSTRSNYIATWNNRVRDESGSGQTVPYPAVLFQTYERRVFPQYYQADSQSALSQL